MYTIKIKRRLIPFAAVLVCTYLMFAMPYSVADGVLQGLKICLYTLLPSLFPFMTLSSYIAKSEALSPFYKLLSPVTRFLFRQPAVSAGVIVMSLIGGFPVGVKMTAALLEGGKITENEAKRLNVFCVNCGPAFAVTAVGVTMYGSSRAGRIIYFSLCLSSVLLGVATAFFADKTKSEKPLPCAGQSPLAALSSAVGDTVQSVLGICAWVVLFSALTACIEKAEFANPFYLPAVCLLEVTKGCALTAGRFPIPVITAAIGFGGFCVHCQIYSYIKQSGLSYLRFFTSRAVNAALSALICQIIITLFPVDISAAAISGEIVPIPFSVSLPAFFALAVMCIVMIFDIDTRQKLW